jgi:hypothetical protein
MKDGFAFDQEEPAVARGKLRWKIGTPVSLSFEKAIQSLLGLPVDPSRRSSVASDTPGRLRLRHEPGLFMPGGQEIAPSFEQRSPGTTLAIAARTKWLTLTR